MGEYVQSIFIRYEYLDILISVSSNILTLNQTAHFRYTRVGILITFRNNELADPIVTIYAIDEVASSATYANIIDSGIEQRHRAKIQERPPLDHLVSKRLAFKLLVLN